MRIRILAVGKIKERYIAEGIAEYSKRLQRYGRFEIAEIKEQPYREPLGGKKRKNRCWRARESVFWQG